MTRINKRVYNMAFYFQGRKRATEQLACVNLALYIGIINHINKNHNNYNDIAYNIITRALFVTAITKVPISANNLFATTTRTKTPQICKFYEKK